MINPFDFDSVAEQIEQLNPYKMDCPHCAILVFIAKYFLARKMTGKPDIDAETFMQSFGKATGELLGRDPKNVARGIEAFMKGMSEGLAKHNIEVSSEIIRPKARGGLH